MEANFIFRYRQFKFTCKIRLCVKSEIEMTITWDWINFFLPFKLYCVALTIEKKKELI